MNAQPITYRDVIRGCAEYAGVPVEAITKPGRAHKRINEARQAGYSILRASGLSYPRIGHRFNRDHTTIMYGVQRADPLIVQAVARIADRLAQERAISETPLFSRAA
jgi:chromosomal replication initiation ATPase DnaA